MQAGVLPAAAAVSLPPPQFIKDAVRMAGELDALASLARRGPFAELPQVLRAAREQLSAAPASSTAI